MSGVNVTISNDTASKTLWRCGNYMRCGFSYNSWVKLRLTTPMNGNSVILKGPANNGDSQHFLNICEVQVCGKWTF